MRVGVIIPTYDGFATGAAFRRLAVTIEELGFDSAWFGDHIVMPEQLPDYLGHRRFDAVACALLGLGMTSRLAFGTDVLVAPYRNPLMLAKMAATASVIAPGRLQLGIGIGWQAEEFEALGVRPYAARAAVTEDYLKALRHVLETEGPLTFESQWVRFRDIRFEPKPEAALPLLAGGNHACALRRAALLGDGCHLLFPREDQYADARTTIERIRAENGISRPFTFSYSCAQTQVLAEDETGFELTHSESAEAGSHYAPGIPCAPDGRPRFVGNAAQLREDCAAFAGAGVDQIVVRFAMTRDDNVETDRYVDQLRRFAVDVLPFCHTL